MLVPLTQSVYVAGELADTERVLLDIGTGYFMEVRRHRTLNPGTAVFGGIPLSDRIPLTGCCTHDMFRVQGHWV